MQMLVPEADRNHTAVVLPFYEGPLSLLTFPHRKGDKPVGLAYVILPDALAATGHKRNCPALRRWAVDQIVTALERPPDRIPEDHPRLLQILEPE